MVMRDAQAGTTIVAAKMQAALARPFHLQGHEVAVSASIGITLHPIDAPDPETLLKYADTAMYRAKQAGRDAVRFFTPQMNAELLARRELEAALRRAIDNGEFELHYQPKVLLATGRVAGVEALLRWRRPDQGMVSPAEFIPALEESGLIVRVGHWVVDTACRQIGEWLRSGIGPLQVSVNVSGRQFIEGDLEGVVLQALAQHRVPAGLLELELTESSLMANTERTVAMLGTLRGHGVEVSIDDFGTGYSSLAYLRRFPVDKLKIDIAFIRHLTESADDAAIVLAIIRMAHSLKLQVIAEGVETAAQLAYLRHHRCDQIQGYHFSRPLPLAELEALMASGKHLPAPPGFRSGAGKTLLIVDDDPDNLEELTILFQPEGYRLLHARTPAEGFDLLAQNAVQVILCDRYMPQMDGIEFLGRANELYPATVRILLSGSVDLESIVAAINRGEVFRFYAKPWHPPTLLQNVHEAFRQYWQQHDDGQEKREPVSADG